MLPNISLAATTWDMPSAYGAGNFISKAYVAFGEDVSARTNGELAITLHPGGSLYSGGDILRAVREGQVPIGGRFLGAHSQQAPMLGLDTIPFLATTREQSRKLYDVSKDAVNAALADMGLKLLFAPVWPPQGLFSKKEVKTVADMNGVKFRAYDASTTRLAELMGAVPTQTEASEIAQAFSTGVAESMIASGAIGTWQKIWDYADYYYEVNAWLPKSGVIVNADAWDGLDSATQAAVTEAAAATEAAVWDEMEVQNDGYKATMAENGMTIAPPSAELQAGLDEIGAKMTDEWIEAAGDAGAAVIEAYRAG
ncbi:MAG: C4-dicarboxylate ABC transporter substrate-binding protein [Gammaproteobacteria bacterium]|nr:C4-dicarboxylate ABC transporter substrate-binding protein [Gammaproteobacteria bacterium]NDA14810.1 C4-dicarboxylate ABC transporter substrate-binding protein [Gammaproteobacteria bacterium]NDG44258.1 C4-dicarboxylate ABC transporter substrate-binding protein [Gammaproteobacteria bacterium]